jgi:ribonuclease HI
MDIVKSLQEIGTIKINNKISRIILIHTDSRINLDSLKNMKNRNYPIESIRKKTIELEAENWYTEYTWIKAHAGHEGNELADKLAKESTRDSEICYNKITKSEIEHQEIETSIGKWQHLWDNATKGRVAKEYFR